jgi:hypothetical protein
MIKTIILMFAVCALMSGFGAFMIASFMAQRSGRPATGLRSPLVAAAVTFVVVWGGMSLGFMHWIAKVA